MKWFKLATCLFVLLVGLSVSANAQLKIGKLKNSNWVEGCSCAFQLKGASTNDRFVFLFDLEKTAYINIDGKDTKLRFVKSSDKRKGRPRVGDRFFEEYTAKGIKVRLDYVTTGVCAPGDESCEVTDYDVTITVTKGKNKQTVKTTGSCGC